MLDVVARSQRGRACVYARGESKLSTPCVLGEPSEGGSGVSLTEGGRVVRICGAEVSVDPVIKTAADSGVACQPMTKDGIAVLRLPVRGDEILPADAEVVVVPNGFEVKGDYRTLVDQIPKVREVAGHGRLLAVLGIADPANLALLVYMGVDVVDDAYCRAMGASGVRLFPEGRAVGSGDVSAENVEDLKREISKIMLYLNAGRLRELVDQRSFSSAEEVAALRVLDDKGYAFEEECYPTASCRFSCNTVQSLRRPDIVRYETRMRELYKPPEHKRVLLLLPCSAKKPYHISRSHRLFASAIHTAQHDTLVHEVIVTSPLGIVPRELDAFYPANSYDIPVTGEWKPEEKDRIRRMLADLVSKGHYEKVVCHLGEDAELVRDMFPDMVETVVGDPVSPTSLKNLDKALREAAKGMDSVSYNLDRDASVKAAMTYQFGPEVADALMDGSKAMGKYPYWKVFRDADGKRTQICMMSAERSMFSLSLDGARIAAEHGYNVVDIQPFELKGSLFAVGVDRADRSIRIGDEAVIRRGGEVVGVGIAKMSGAEMEQTRRGVAVQIRHHRPGPQFRSLSATSPLSAYIRRKDG